MTATWRAALESRANAARYGVPGDHRRTEEESMPQPATGMLLVWTDVPSAEQDDFNEWYDREHLSDRVSVPGFVSGRRYRAVSGTPEFFAVYETRDPGVLASSAYRDKLQHPTPWSRRVMPHFRNTIRGVCERTGRAGFGAGGFVATLRFAPDPAHRWPLRQWLNAAGLARAAGRTGVMAITVAEGQDAAADKHTAKEPTAELALRGGSDRVVDWAILLEGVSPELIGAAARALLADIAEAEGLVPLTAEIGIYRYLCGVRSDDLGE
jgi:hypothetical protein